MRTKLGSSSIVASAPLHPSSRTVDGHTIDLNADVWSLPTAAGPASINFTNLSGASDSLRTFIKQACTAMLLSAAPVRVMRAVSAYRTLIRFLSTGQEGRVVEEIGVRDLHQFGDSLSERQRYQLKALKEYLILWSDSGAPGLTSELRELLPRMITESHEVGAAVRTMDPEKGPLTDIEFEGVLAALHKGFSVGEICLSDYTLLILAITLAARPLQLAMIKVKDFSVTLRHDNSALYILQVTRIKQGKGIRPRTLFRPRELASGVGELLCRQCDIAIAFAVAHGIDSAEAPLFPSIDARMRGVELADLGLDGHFSGKSLGAKLSRLMAKLNVRSHRTGEPIKLFQTRLRRTFGTRAAAEGLSAVIIADLLDHSWVDSSLIYIETRPTMIARIDKALALTMAPLAQAFSGILVRREEGARGKVIHFANEAELTQVGGCGKFAFCGLAAPLACYTCAYFRPWLDAPHELLLDRLCAEREQLLQATDLRHAAINDRTIVAVAEVAEVVALCHASVGGAP